jgi:hypothetical protein
MLERLSALEKKAYEKLSEILDEPLNDDNMGEIRKAILDVLSLVRGRVNPSDETTNILLQQNVTQNTLNVAGGDGKGAPNVDDLKARLKEIELLENVVEEGETK